MALLSADSNSQKITQAYCQYGPGSPQANCGICHHYLGNETGMRSPNVSCEIVQDPIRPDMVCRFFCPAQKGGGMQQQTQQQGAY